MPQISAKALASRFPVEMNRRIGENNYSQIINGDETGFYWEKMLSRIF